MRMYRSPRAPGFTLVELLVVIAVLAILAAVALPRFVRLGEESHDAQGRALFGAFDTAVRLARSKWIAQGGGASVDMESTVVAVGPGGWPGPGAPTSDAACRDVWNGVLAQPPDATIGFAPGTDGWGVLSGGPGITLCGFIYEPDTTPVRAIVYDVSTGVVGYIGP